MTDITDAIEDWLVFMEHTDGTEQPMTRTCETILSCLHLGKLMTKPVEGVMPKIIWAGDVDGGSTRIPARIDGCFRGIWHTPYHQITPEIKELLKQMETK